jgi:nicotinate phosphoribosyltransferase
MFFISKDEEIKEGLTSDIYFFRAEEILKAKGVNNHVLAEFTIQHLENPWAVFVGLPEVIEILKDKPVNLWALREGSIFKSRDIDGVPVPVMVIEGKYLDFGKFETPVLGFICEASGIATKAARVKKFAGDKSVLSFGVRRMHPALAPLIDRSSYIGGCDGVSSVIGARTIGKVPTGTLPHALVINLGDVGAAVKAFNEVVDPMVPRITLVDTFCDEKFEAIEAANAIKEKLFGVRLDTPQSRRGSIVDIVREVKWELRIRGFNEVKVFVSGGLDESSIPELIKAGADGFGVGTSIANANTVDFAMDIVELEGKPLAKRGKFSGKKKVYRVFKNGTVEFKVVPFLEEFHEDNYDEALVPILKNGEVVYKEEQPVDVRNYVLEQLSKIEEI